VRYGQAWERPKEGPLERWTDSTTEDPYADAIVDARAFRAAADRSLAHGEGRAIVVVDLGDPADLLASTQDVDEVWAALVAAAEARTAKAIRPADLLGRLAHGIFAVLTEVGGGPDGSRRVALRVAERLDQPFNLGGRQLSVRPRIGVADPGGSADSADAMLRRAAQVAR